MNVVKFFWYGILALSLFGCSFVSQTIRYVKHVPTCGILIVIDGGSIPIQYYNVLEGRGITKRSCQVLAGRLNLNPKAIALVVNTYPMRTIYCYFKQPKYIVYVIDDEKDGVVGKAVCDLSPADWIKTYK